MAGFTKPNAALSRSEGTIIDDTRSKTFSLWSVDLGYSLLWCAMLLWAKLKPGSFRFSSGATTSPISQIMCACAMLTPLFIPFVVYYLVTAGKRRLSSFSPVGPARTGPVYLKEVSICFLLTVTPLLSAYLLFNVIVRLEPTTNLVPSLPVWFFLTFVVFLSLLTSLTSVALAYSDNGVSPLIAQVLATFAVLLPFVLSQLVTGASFLSHGVRFIQAVQASTVLTLLPLFLSALMGSLFLLQARIRES